MREAVRPGRREAAGDRGARSVHRGRLDCRLGAGHGMERTLNMLRMVVTLEVSKLSGWLNDPAPCRESKGGHTVCGVRCGLGGGRAADDRGARNVQGKAHCRLGAGHGEERT